MNIFEDLFSMKGKVILITGATGLLGTEYCQTFAKAGANVIVADLNEVKCKELACSLEERYTQKMFGIRMDVSNKEEVIRVFKEINKIFGRLDVLINNAAFNCPASNNGANFVDFVDYPLNLWQSSLDVNLTGAFLCSQEAIKIMRNNKVGKDEIKGSIINISSTYGLIAPDQRIYLSIKNMSDPSKRFVKPADYSTTKSGLINFTRYLAAYCGGDRIKVNSLTPGGVFDNQSLEFVKEYCLRTPLGRMANKDDYNGAILFLASNASKYMTGSNIIVDGGWTAW